MDKTRACGARNRGSTPLEGNKMLTLETSISELPRIGKKYFKQFNKLGIFTIRDLFYYFPYRYNDFSNIIPISELQPNKIFTIQGEVSAKS